ncbi:MAG: dephospho-CoA kinase [Lachnospiraceae bacterium]|nr:dephospho-CoA kinase [Lachnospiraceae bacterium]
MKTIGITGGVGSGKTEILAYIKSRYNCKVILADEVAHEVCRKGQRCYAALVHLLGREVLDQKGEIHRGRMAEQIFRDSALLQRVNACIHPAVKEYILEAIAVEREKGLLEFLFVEAALLIEDGYGALLDELWYIYAEEQVRRDRLKAARGYSDRKISEILRRQLSEEEYRVHCRVVIDNSGSLQHTCEQIDRKLEEYL